jgi:hypothetical protein
MIDLSMHVTIHYPFESISFCSNENGEQFERDSCPFSASGNPFDPF